MADQSFLDAINGDPLTAVQRAQDWLAKANAAPAQPKSVVAAQNFLSAIDSTPPPQIDKTWDEFKLGNNTDAMSAGGQAEQYKLWNAQYAIPYAKSYIADPAQQTAWLKTAETDAVAQGLVKIAPKDGNVAKDFALGVGQGVVGSVDSLFKLFNPAAKSPVDAAVEYLKGAVSDQSKDQALRDAETAKAAADKAKAEGKGEVAQWFAEFGQSLTNAVKNPVSLGSIAGSAATSFVPGAIVGKGLQVAGAGAKAIRAGAIGANTVFGAAVEAGGARSDSYDAIAKMPIDQLRQTPAYQTAKSLAPNASDDVLREQLAQSAAEFTNRGTLLAGAAGGVGGALGAFGLGGKTKVGRFATELISEPVTEGITPVGTNINVRTVDPTRTLTEGTANAAAQGLIGGVGGGIADSSLSKAKQAFGAPVVNDPLLSPNANKENAPNFNYGNYDVFAKANPEFVDYLRSASPTTLDRIVADPDPKAPLLTQALINLSADPKTAELAGRTINYLAGLANDAGTSQTDTSQTTASTTTDQETTGALSGATSELQRPSPDAAQRADVPPVGGATEQTTSQTVQPVAGPNVLGQAASSVVGRSNAQGNIVPTRQDGGRPAATGSLDFNPLDGERTAIERLLRAAVPADYPIIAKAHAESYAQYLAQENADGNPTQGVPDFEAKTLQAMRDYANGKKPKAGNTSANGARIDAQGALVPESQYIATLDASQPTLFRQANAAPFLATDAGQPAIDRVKQRIESVLGSGALARLPNVNIIAGNGTVQQTAAQGFFNPADGQITLVADNIKAGNEIAVLMHEIGHKRLAQSLGATGYKRLNDAVKAWKSKPAESNERQVYDFANAQANNAARSNQNGLQNSQPRTDFRGKVTIQKVTKRIKESIGRAFKTNFGISQAIAKEYSSPQDLLDHLYYHGTSNYIEGGLRPSIRMTEKQAEQNGGGGYGERYYAVSLTKSRKVAANFSGTRRSVDVYPILLKKNSLVETRPDIKDAAEIEDHIVDLWTRGVDAVWIGGGEQELAVINPASMITIKKSKHFQAFELYKQSGLDNITLAEATKIYNDSTSNATQYAQVKEGLSKDEREAFANTLQDLEFSIANTGQAPSGKFNQATYDAEFLAYAIERAEQLGLSPDLKKPVGTVENWLALASKLFSAAFGKLGLGKRPDLTVQDLTALARGAALLELTDNAPTATANVDRNTPSESDILYSKQSAPAADIEQAINAAAPNRPVKLVAPKQPLDVGWALRQALVDYQAPVAKMLDTVFGAGEHLNSRLWQSLKTYSTKRDAAGEAFNSGDRRVIDDAIKAIADHSGMDIAEAAGVAGEYAKVVHIPDGNAGLQGRRNERIKSAKKEFDFAQTAVQDARKKLTDAQLNAKESGTVEAKLLRDFFAKEFERINVRYNSALSELSASQDPLNTLAGGLTDAEAKATQQAIEQRIPVALLQAAQQGLVAANRNALQRLVDAGIATKQTQSKLLADYPNYVPLFVTDDVTDPFNSLGRSDLFTAGMNETVLKAMKGYGKDSASVAENGYVTTIAKIAAINARIASQDFKLAALAMSRLPQGQGHVESKAITSPTQQLDPRGMSVRDPVTGEWHSVSFVDQSVADSVYNRNVEDNNDLVAKAIGIPTRILSKAVTQFVLAFAPINMIRDTQAKILLSRTSKYLDAQGNPVSPTKLGNRVAANAANPNTWRAAFDIAFGRTPANPSPTYLAMKEAIDNGALSTWGDVLNKSKAGAVDTLKQQYGLRKIPTTMLQTVEGYNTWFDMISSMSSYLAMRELGIDPKSAAFNTLDMMNFRNKGAKTGTIRAFYAFANPTLQDSAKIVQLLKTRRGQVDTLALIAIGTAIYAMTKAIAGDDEEKVLGNIVDQRGTFESERTISLCINKDFCLKVPVGFGQAQIAWLIATTGSRMNSGRYTTTEGLGELAKGAAKTFSPVGYSEVPVATDPFGWLMSTLVPTIFKPSYAVAANKSAFGTPLAKPEKKGVFRSENAKASTEALWVETAQSFRRITGGDIAPEYIKEIILGLPMFAGPVAESIKAATNNKSERGAKLDIRDELRYLMPLGIGRVIGGDAHYLEASYYEQLKDGERLIKQLNLDVPKLGASKLGKSGTDFTKRVEQSTTMSAADKLLAVAYFNESRRAQSAAMDKAKDLKPLTGADNADKRLEVITQYSDESRSAMLQYLKDSGFRAK